MQCHLAPDRSLAPTLSRRAGERTRIANFIAKFGHKHKGPAVLQGALAFSGRSVPNVATARHHQTENEDPQPQVVDAFGLRMTN